MNYLNIFLTFLVFTFSVLNPSFASSSCSAYLKPDSTISLLKRPLNSSYSKAAANLLAAKDYLEKLEEKNRSLAYDLSMANSAQRVAFKIASALGVGAKNAAQGILNANTYIDGLDKHSSNSRSLAYDLSVMGERRQAFMLSSALGVDPKTAAQGILNADNYIRKLERQGSPASNDLAYDLSVKGEIRLGFMVSSSLGIKPKTAAQGILDANVYIRKLRLNGESASKDLAHDLSVTGEMRQAYMIGSALGISPQVVAKRLIEALDAKASLEYNLPYLTAAVFGTSKDLN